MNYKIYRPVLIVLCGMILFASLSGGLMQAFYIAGSAEQPSIGLSGPPMLGETGNSVGEQEIALGNKEMRPESEREGMESQIPEEEMQEESRKENEGSTADIKGAATEYAPGVRIVYTYDELKSALETDNGVTAVHLGRDIAMDGGVTIHNSKSHVTISGLDPSIPGQTVPYTLIDFDSMLQEYTIFINSSEVKDVLVTDLKIVGKNYYGPVSAVLTSVTSGLTLTFRRVEYDGPQIGFHRQGTLRIDDCKVRLHGGNGYSPSQEFAETKDLIFEGKNTIDTDTQDYSIFWYPAGGSLTLENDASVKIVSPKTSVAFGMFYTDAAAGRITVDIGQGARFDATISHVVTPARDSTISRIAIGEGGMFRLNATGAVSQPILSTGGKISVAPRASFHVIASKSNTALVNLQGGSLICDNPASVLLYNPGNRDILAAGSAGSIYLDAEQINYWRIASTGGPEDPPFYRWKKADGSNMWIDGNLAIGAGGNFTVTSNYEAGDSPGTAPDKNSLDMALSRVLALGRLELLVNNPPPYATGIAGVTAPGAMVHASYEGVALPEVQAGEDGVFFIPSETPLPPFTVVTVASYLWHLSAMEKVTVDGERELTFSAEEDLRFHTTALSAKKRLIGRAHPDWKLTVSDTRGAGNTWKIFARETKPLKAEDQSVPILHNALVFVDETGKAVSLAQLTLIYSHTSASDNEAVTIGWASDRGVMASIPTGAAYSNVTYSGTIEWDLTDAP